MAVHFSGPGWERREASISHTELQKDLSLVILSRADSYSVIAEMLPDGLGREEPCCSIESLNHIFVSIMS